MSRKFISLIVAASIAVTGMTAAPAQAASDRDLARALAAIAGVVIVGAVIQEARKDKRQVAPRYYNNNAYRTYRPYRAEPKHVRKHERKHMRKHKRKHHKSAVDRAYRQGYADHRRIVRERRAQRRAPQYQYGDQHRYSARPYGYSN
ncbi:hypothetical protein [Roseovarius sp. Pro17]|uniref:hypothetical protein n=1 Tax=Roseovarius sp. Pro17 TaxID=3108175 RepID=UPI002D779E32|nr:hypothetical protein [Roseovarius sp. Pro17]